MNMFEQAAAAWKIQRESERVQLAKRDGKLREEFSGLLQQITGVSDFTVRGPGEKMSAEIEGVRFHPRYEVLQHHRGHVRRMDND